MGCCKNPKIGLVDVLLMLIASYEKMVDVAMIIRLTSRVALILPSGMTTSLFI